MNAICRLTLNDAHVTTMQRHKNDALLVTNAMPRKYSGYPAIAKAAKIIIITNVQYRLQIFRPFCTCIFYTRSPATAEI